MKNIIDAFIAFHVNGINNLLYVIGNNLWFLLIGACAIVTVIVFLKEEIQVTVHEEQQIL